MTFVTLAQPWTEQPQGAARVDWSHPFFAGASTAYVALPGAAVFSLQGGAFFPFGRGNVSNGAANANVSPSIVGLGYTPESSTRVVVCPAIPSRHTLLCVSSSLATVSPVENNNGAWINAQPNGWSYSGIANFTSASVTLGGGAVGASGRRSYSVSGASSADACIAIRPDAAITNAPVVYIGGKACAVSYSSGTAAAYAWGTAAVNTYDCGLTIGSLASVPTARVQLLVLTDSLPSNALLAEVSANPWQLFE